MNIVVAGGMGFIGSNFIRRLNTAYPDAHIINFDALTYAGNPENLRDIANSDWYTFVKGDIACVEEVESLFKEYKPEIIVNFAAETHVDRSFVDSGRFIRTNVVGVEVLLKAVAANNVRHFIQISTDEVYGDVPFGFSSETSPMRPSSPYAASKASADMLVQSYIRCHGTPVSLVRGSNNFGPYQYPEKLIPLAITNILIGEKIPIHGSGDHVRTWLHADDFSDGIIAIMESEKAGEIYNIGGTEWKNIDIISRIVTHLGVTLESSVEYTPDRPGADFRYAPSGEKIAQEFGFTPQKNINDTLADVVQWYVTHEEWWQTIREQKEFIDHYEKQKRANYY